MFKRLLGRDRTGNQRIVDALYREIVAAARQPELYREWEVPDTPLGRFEMLALHVFLVLDRLQDEGPAPREVAQDLTDTFFADVENSLRELGIGDLGIPKRMKKLARMFYGRALSYGDALRRGDEDGLACALARNVRPGAEPDAAAHALARYVAGTRGALADQDVDALISANVFFPQAGIGQRSVA